MSVYRPQEARNNRSVLRFDGRVLGESSSRRPGAPRWSDVTIYGLAGGGYVLARRGCSTMMHRPDCRKVSGDMVPWIGLDDDAERQKPWTPCPKCRPDVAEPDPQSLVEGTRYTAATARSPEELIELLWRQPPHLPPLTRIVDFLREAVEQACIRDAELAAAWAHHHP